jgi:hypothetical protein
MGRLIATAGEDMGAYNTLLKYNTPDEEKKAALLVVTHATSKEDALDLLQVLGITK